MKLTIATFFGVQEVWDLLLKRQLRPAAAYKLAKYYRTSVVDNIMFAEQQRNQLIIDHWSFRSTG